MSIPLPNQSRAVQAVTSVNNYNLSVDELNDFMRLHGFSDRTLAEFLGVTVQGVRLWLREQRDISLTTTRIIRLMVKYPHLMKEF